MNHKLISVIIINYNTFELTANCIQSILSNEIDLDYEIILVDNHSTERDPEEFTRMFPKITLVTSPANVGFAKGNNLGIAQSIGDFIVLLNSDTMLLNKAITVSYQFLKKNPQVGAVTARLEYQDGTVQHNCQRFPSVYFKVLELLRIQRIFPSLKSSLFGSFFSYDAVAYPDWIWGAFFMFKKDILGKLKGGKLADDFFMYGEDMQWCMDLRKRGLKVAFVPDAHVIHLLGKSKGAKNEWMDTNQKKFMRMYYSLPHRKVINLLDMLLKIRIRIF